MALRIGPLRIPWPSKDPHKDDRYWDFFINTPPADLANTVTEMIRKAPEGTVFPARAELHTPEITSSHVKGMAQYFGADLVGIVRLTSDQAPSPLPSPPRRGRGAEGVVVAKLDSKDLFPLPRAGEGKGEGAADYPFGVVCAVRADYDTRHAPGIGGQVPVQNGLFITFVLSAWIRELGYRATVTADSNRAALAAAAGLGQLDSDGKLVTPKFGTRVYVADVIRTDLPLAPDG